MSFRLGPCVVIVMYESIQYISTTKEELLEDPEAFPEKHITFVGIWYRTF